MKYFEMIQDNRISYDYKIENLEWEKLDTDEEEKEIVGIVSFKGKEESLPDFIAYKKHFFVSAALKKVMEMYSEDLKFNLVMFNNIESKIQKEYYDVESPLIEGLSDNSTYHKDHSVDKKIIKHEKVKDYPVFRLKEMETTQFSPKHIFVHLDIVESAIRRELWGMIFEEIQVEE
ncbi:hypothetical protein [Clostridium sp. ZBS4]|uniref:hypothetical protein n=1 Tax=Clostridium sp. ZBS4 TaxID=2949974 RepID=UPI002079467A|nr:hypothetical protein [Clostridium sp. ZBS4]